MRIRIRGPEGASTLTLLDESTIADLMGQIRIHTGIANFDVKYGFPPKSLHLERRDSSELLSKLDIKLDGEQLTVSPTTNVSENSSESYKDVAQQKALAEAKNFFRFVGSSAPHMSTSNPATLDKRLLDEVPEVPMPSRGATVVLRVMPDDNSCLFRAVGAAVLPGVDQSMPELRSLIASTIQEERHIYTSVVLEKSPDDYCRWIQTLEAWGGAIELGILAKHFEIEICSIDVESLRIDKFNEGRSTRCIIVYSGIHYDTIAQSPSYPPHLRSHASPDLDQRTWDSHDSEILSKAMELCRILHSKHYYSNTRSMRIRCNTCGAIFHGEQAAAQHAQQIGHSDMSQINN